MVDEFCTALGHFVFNYAHAEIHFKMMLAHHSGVTSEVGRAIFSGTRLRTGIDHVRRIHEANGTTIHPRIVLAMEQLATINDARDKLLHQGFNQTPVPGRFVTSNYMTAHIDDKIKALFVSTETLHEMSADLRRIQLYMSFWGFDDRSGELSTFDQAMQELAKEPHQPWLYTPHAPASRKGTSGQGALSIPLQPPASPA